MFEVCWRLGVPSARPYLILQSPNSPRTETPKTCATTPKRKHERQKTLATTASAMDRINVSRLIVYLRYHLDLIAKPFLFEPNDRITRDQVTDTFNRFLEDLTSKRALFDFLVVCDETNNTGARIDRNELYIDIAIQPVKAIEFIYIPLRIKNTGESLTS